MEWQRYQLLLAGNWACHCKDIPTLTTNSASLETVINDANYFFVWTQYFLILTLIFLLFKMILFSAYVLLVGSNFWQLKV